MEPDGSINYNNIKAFSSADYGFIFLMHKTERNRKRRTSVWPWMQKSTGVSAALPRHGALALMPVCNSTKVQWRKQELPVVILPLLNAWSFTFNEKREKKYYISLKMKYRLSQLSLLHPASCWVVARDFKLEQENWACWPGQYRPDIWW